MGQANLRGNRQERIAQAKKVMERREAHLTSVSIQIVEAMTEEEEGQRTNSLNRLALFMGKTVDSLTPHDKRDKWLHEMEVAAIHKQVSDRLSCKKTS